MFESDGILFVALLRLLFLPWGLACYCLSVTSVSLFDYVIGNTIYIIKIIIVCVLGCSLYEASEAPTEEDRTTQIIIIVVEVILTVCITIGIMFWANNEK